MMAWPHIAMLLIASIAAVTDYRTGRIPNWLTFPALALTPLVFALEAGSIVPAGAALGAIVGCGLAPYLMFRCNALGGGDVKLFAALGGLGGMTLGLELMMFSFSLAMVLSLVLLSRSGQLRHMMANLLKLLRNLVLPKARRVRIQPAQLHSLRLAPAIFLGTLWTLGSPLV